MHLQVSVYNFSLQQLKLLLSCSCCIYDSCYLSGYIWGTFGPRDYSTVVCDLQIMKVIVDIDKYPMYVDQLIISVCSRGLRYSLSMNIIKLSMFFVC